AATSIRFVRVAVSQKRERQSPRQQQPKIPNTRTNRNLFAPLGCGMKNIMLNPSILNLLVVALFTLLFAGWAVAPEFSQRRSDERPLGKRDGDVEVDHTFLTL